MDVSIATPHRDPSDTPLRTKGEPRLIAFSPLTDSDLSPAVAPPTTIPEQDLTPLGCDANFTDDTSVDASATGAIFSSAIGLLADATRAFGDTGGDETAIAGIGNKIQALYGSMSDLKHHHDAFSKSTRHSRRASDAPRPAHAMQNANMLRSTLSRLTAMYTTLKHHHHHPERHVSAERRGTRPVHAALFA